jgi:hypothetical protein
VRSPSGPSSPGEGSSWPSPPTSARRQGILRPTPNSSPSVGHPPCPMCAGAAHASRLSRLVYAAPDPKAGYAGTLHNTPTDSRLNHTLIVESGLLEERAAALLRDFFRYRRRRPGEASESPLP